MQKVNLGRIKSNLVYLCIGLLFMASALLPAFIARSAFAAQLTSRSLSIASAKPGQSAVQYTFSFVLGTLTGTSDVEGIKIEACTTAIGTCSGTAGTDVPDVGSVTFVSQNGNWQGATNFAVDGTGGNDCTSGNKIICLKRTDTTNQTTGTARTLVLGTITNPSTANTSFFMRITTYDNNAWSISGGANNQSLDTGTVASAVTQTLTINAAVAEILNFCIGSTTVDSDSTGTVATDCTGVSGTSVNLGILDSSKVSITPETASCTPSDCVKNGVAMLRTNASAGATISYDSIQQSGTRHLGTLRIVGQTCSTDSENVNTSNTDACFNVRTAQATFDTTSERFGMTVAGVNCGSTSSYTCSGTSQANLVRDTAYDCDGTNTYPSGDLDQINGPTTCGYAWDEQGNMTPIASSTSSTTKQVDDEALILKFAAHPMLTTPFGSYSAQADFVAVATY